MSNSKNYKIIYSLKIHIRLQEMGFQPKIEMRNPQNPQYNCWAYDATPELLEAFDQVVSNNGI